MPDGDGPVGPSQSNIRDGQGSPHDQVLGCQEVVPAEKVVRINEDPDVQVSTFPAGQAD